MPEKFDVETSFDIHFGVPIDKVEEFRKNREFEFYETYADGDGWESWGEKIGTDANDEKTAHVIVRMVDLDEAIFTAHSVVQQPDVELVPMANQSHAGSNGTIVVVTEAADWANVVM